MYSIRYPTDPITLVVSSLVMTHIATINALAFVQASKREKRFMYHDPENRFAIILEGNHRAFIYRGHRNIISMTPSDWNRLIINRLTDG